MSLQLEQHAHQRDHVRLRDGLVLPDRERCIVVSAPLQRGLDKQVARHPAHRRQHTLVVDTAGMQLLFNHLLACLVEIHGQRSCSFRRRTSEA